MRINHVFAEIEIGIKPEETDQVIAVESHLFAAVVLDFPRVIELGLPV